MKNVKQEVHEVEGEEKQLRLMVAEVKIST